MGQTVSRAFSAPGEGDAFGVGPGESLSYAVSGTYSGAMIFERSVNGGLSWEAAQVGESGQAFDGRVRNEGTATARYRWRSLVSTGSAVTEIADVDDVVRTWRNRAGEARLEITDSGVRLYGSVTVMGA